MGLPIEVRAGFIGKIRLKVPVSQIRTAPWEISIDQLYLVTGPVRLADVSYLFELNTRLFKL